MELTVFCYWDKGITGMPPMIRFIYEHNVQISKQYHFNYTLITDDNVSEYISPPRQFNRLAPNFKSDVVRFFALDKYGGIWLDSDVIILKDLNVLYAKVRASGKLAMLDVEFNKEIGCASLVMMPNSELTKMAIGHIRTRLDSGRPLSWGDLGPLNIRNVYSRFASDILLNGKDDVIKGCNFISWVGDPGIHKHGWLCENASSKAAELLNNTDCYYVMSWTIYRINNIKSDIVGFVFGNEASVFTHLVKHTSGLTPPPPPPPPPPSAQRRASQKTFINRKLGKV